MIEGKRVTFTIPALGSVGTTTYGPADEEQTNSPVYAASYSTVTFGSCQAQARRETPRHGRPAVPAPGRTEAP